MDTIWILSGHAGDYEETQTWLVAAFTSEEVAEAYRVQCQAHADQNPTKYDEELNRITRTNPFDEFDVTYLDDPKYYVAALAVKG